jgi:hypothetical protein
MRFPEGPAFKDELDPVRVHEWNWPVRVDLFLAQLADSGITGDSDAERVDTFMAGQAAVDMPAALRDDLEREGLL